MLREDLRQGSDCLEEAGVVGFGAEGYAEVLVAGGGSGGEGGAGDYGDAGLPGLGGDGGSGCARWDLYPEVPAVGVRGDGGGGPVRADEGLAAVAFKALLPDGAGVLAGADEFGDEAGEEG